MRRIVFLMVEMVVRLQEKIRLLKEKGKNRPETIDTDQTKSIQQPEEEEEEEFDEEEVWRMKSLK